MNSKITLSASHFAGTWLLLLAVLLAALDNVACEAQDSTSKAPGATAGERPLVEAPEPGSNAPSDEATSEEMRTNSGSGRRYRGPLVVFGRDAELKAGDSAEAVVVIFGSAKVLGKVRESVVTIGGHADIEGDVRRAVVSIFGDVRVGKDARLHEEAVAVGGDISVDGEVRRDVVAVLGDVKTGPGAHLGGETAAVGGRVDVADGASLDRQPTELDFGGISKGLRKWLWQCVVKMRPLAPQVGFVWIVAGFFFLLYLAIALLFPRPVKACVSQLTTRPAATFFMGLLAKLLLPVVTAVLIITGIGAIVVPFVLAALMFGVFVGKVALFESLGSGLGRRLGADVLQLPLVAFLAGILIITALYMVPVLGLIAFGVVSLWGLGGAVTAAFTSFRRERTEKPIAPPLAAGAPVMNPVGTPAVPNPAGDPTEYAPQPATAPPTMPSAPPVNLPEALAFPRASFWERMGAGFLDLTLVGVIGGLAHVAPLGFLLALAYFAGMWTWKGTTVGGIVLGLKVVRLDGQPVTLVVALVRALAAAFSAFVLFLGFLWVAWDPDKQGWHDKIAGTVVVRMPRGTPLVCV